MPEIDVIRHILRPHQPFKGEEYDPASDVLVIVHRNPLDHDDPTEFGHHVNLQGIAYRKEMWNLDEYSDVIDRELKDLERFYFRDESIDYGPHPLAALTEHYYMAPRQQMRSFSPGYVIDRMASVMPFTTDGMSAFARDVALSGLDDVKGCLGSSVKQSFPCRGMTRLSAGSVDMRIQTESQIEEQTQQIDLIPGQALDEVRQLVTDRAPELETVRESFVNQVLLEAQVPDLMATRAKAELERREGAI